MLYELILINEIEQRAKIIFLSVGRAAPQQLKSVYTGCDKATIENHSKFLSIRYK